MNEERTPLLQHHAGNFWDFSDRNEDDLHQQFCKLTGCPPSNLPHNASSAPIGKTTLYGRALEQRRKQDLTYGFTASLSNTLLLSQVVLGAALTALGASESSHILITVFGATNTIIAGVVAYLKSRGQPMRARMYRDDLERVVDEIENSEIMWRGISRNMHGYSDINTDGEVTIRSEVARLTRLYDRAVRNNTMNNPDMYMAGAIDATNTALRSKSGAPVPQPIPAPGIGIPTSTVPISTAAPPAQDPDQSPATAPPKPAPKEEQGPNDAAKDDTHDATEASRSSSPGTNADEKPSAKAERDSVASPVTADTKSHGIDDTGSAESEEATKHDPDKRV